MPINYSKAADVFLGCDPFQGKITGAFIFLCPKIVKVIYHDPATIVFWDDGTKTVVKCSNESYDPEKGLAMAISKKALGNNGHYYETFKKWAPEIEPLEEGSEKPWPLYETFKKWIPESEPLEE